MNIKRHLAIGFAFLFLGFSAHGTAGGIGSTGGGDAVVQDFVVSAYGAHKLLQDMGGRITPSVDLAKFKSTIAADHIEATDTKLMIKGAEVTAFYDQATDKISVNRSRWREINKAPEKQRLAAHEIFRRMGLNDDDYQISKQLPDKDVIVIKLKIAHQSPKPKVYDSVVVFDDLVAVPTEDCSIYRGEMSHCRGSVVLFHDIDGLSVRTELVLFKQYREGKLEHYNVFAYTSYDKKGTYDSGKLAESRVYLYDLAYKNIGLKLDGVLPNKSTISGKDLQIFWDLKF